MTATELELSPEEETRALLFSAIPKLPEAVRTILLADPAVLTTLGLPTGDFIRIWNRRFSRQELFTCLRNIADDVAAPLASADRELEVEEAWLDEDGAGVLRSGTEAARFANVAVLSDNLDRRSSAIDAIVASGEMSLEQEGIWRAAIAEGPLTDALFLALESEIGASPEAAFRAMVHDIGEGSAKFDDLVPLDLNHYAGLLGISPPPTTLSEFKSAWLAAAAALDNVRLLRLLKLSGPLSILPGGLVAQASDHLPATDRVTLAQFLKAAADPFSVIAAFEIACRHRADPAMEAIGDALAHRLFDRSDPLIEIASPALASTLAITTAITARYQTLADWPLHAKRLARVIHASHLLRLFRTANVDPAIFEDEVMRSFAPQARLADLCDAREAPRWQPHHFVPALVHAIAMARMTAAIGDVSETDVPQAWLAAGETALAGDVEAGWGLFLFAPSPLDELDVEWKGPTFLTPENVEEAYQILEAGDDLERSLSELIKMSVAFEIPADRRGALAAVLPAFLKRLDGANFMIVGEITLQLAARWRDEALADRTVDILLERARGEGLPDAAAAPRLIMLAAAAVEDRALWLQRAGNLAQHFAYAQKSGPPSINLMRALELLREFEPELGPRIASAKAYTVLTFDRLPRLAPATSSVGTEDARGGS